MSITYPDPAGHEFGAARPEPRWLMATLVCRMCETRQVSIYPEDVFDETAMECEACGHMTAEPEDVEGAGHV
ncbi:hypothetical protein LCGC14_2225120 [marine sediment metagenome]|uniref:Uncharacterized protein n=1 Tax=marine sediment metagenome TaxID=412755 RepID=A0A0F9G5C3_9ZZZZ